MCVWRSLWLPLGLALLGCSSARASFQAFLQVVPAQGPTPVAGSRDPLYTGWVEVLGFGAGIENPITFSTTMTSGRPVINKFVLSKSVDAATPVLFNYLASGATLSSVKLVLVIPGQTRVELWELRATTCGFSGQSIQGGVDQARLEEHLEIQFGTMEWSYTQVDLAGDPVREHFASWDAIQARRLIGSRSPTWAGATDTDGDGLPDDWEIFHGLDRQVADADTDRDADGIPARLEYLARTDPNSPQSVFRVTSFEAGAGPAMTLTWQSVPGRTYRVTRASSPGGPYTTQETVTATGPVTQAVVPFAGSAVFFRVETP